MRRKGLLLVMKTEVRICEKMKMFLMFFFSENSCHIIHGLTVMSHVTPWIIWHEFSPKNHIINKKSFANSERFECSFSRIKYALLYTEVWLLQNDTMKLLVTCHSSKHPPTYFAQISVYNSNSTLSYFPMHCMTY